MTRRVVVLSLLFLLCFCTNGPNHRETLSELIERYYKEGYYNGTILIADSTGILLEQAYGMADFADSARLSVNSTFYLASLSKQFTAMAVMLLRERGLLSYDDPLSRYFPSFPPWAGSVTIRHLLTHTSGIPDYYELDAAMPGFTNADVESVAAAVERLNFSPGEKYEYSNTAYVLLSSIVQKVSGMGFNQFMQQNVFGPLGMTSTVAYDESRPERIGRCKGFDADGNEDDYPYFTTGGGGIYSNVKDLYKWHMGLQDGLLVPKASYAEAFKPMKINDGSLSWYGFGWMLDNENPNRIFHTGTLTSFRTYIERDIRSQRFIVMLNNVGKTKREELMQEIRSVLEWR